jgi:hypothetical protein
VRYLTIELDRDAAGGSDQTVRVPVSRVRISNDEHQVIVEDHRRGGCVDDHLGHDWRSEPGQLRAPALAAHTSPPASSANRLRRLGLDKAAGNHAPVGAAFYRPAALSATTANSRRPSKATEMYN